MKRICIVIFLISISFNLHSKENSGGVIVGNGAGFVEYSFQSVYINLKHILTNYLTQKMTDQNREKEILEKIISNIELDLLKDKKIIFISEKLNPGFFTTGPAEHDRIAKTFSDKSSSIYINSDLLYVSGRPALNNFEITSILVHELGHQAGEDSHAFLDQLASKISMFTESLSGTFNFKTDDLESDNFVRLTITNLKIPSKISLLALNIRNEYALDLTSTVLSTIQCSYDTESFVGVEINNGHYSFGTRNNLFFNAWVFVSCYESFSQKVNVYRRDLTLNFTNDFSFQSLFIN